VISVKPKDDELVKVYEFFLVATDGFRQSVSTLLKLSVGPSRRCSDDSEFIVANLQFCCFLNSRSGISSQGLFRIEMCERVNAQVDIFNFTLENFTRDGNVTLHFSEDIRVNFTDLIGLLEF
jgi:hypothetical protein